MDPARRPQALPGAGITELPLFKCGELATEPAELDRQTEADAETFLTAAADL